MLDGFGGQLVRLQATLEGAELDATRAAANLVAGDDTEHNVRRQPTQEHCLSFLSS